MIGLTYGSQWTWAFGLAAIISVVGELATRALDKWTVSKSWWPRARALQRAMNRNFGFPEDQSDELVLDAWSSVIAHVTIHAICACFMIPLILAGSWEAASPLARDAFVLGTLSDVGFDIYHGLKLAFTTFAPDRYLSACGWNRAPIELFVVMDCLHHPLSMCLAIPMNAKYVDSRDYHMIAFSLLAAAAFCFSFNSYKMTLDVTKRREFILFKVILVNQLVVIVWTRLFLWFPAVYRLQAAFAASGDDLYWYGGVAAATLMSFFNLAILNDAIVTNVKWLPKFLPEPEEATKPLFLRELSLSSTGSVQSLFQGPSKFKVAGHAVVAANRLRKLSTVESKSD